MTDRGRVVVSDGRTILRFVRRFPTSREDVWSAITDADRTARWSFRAEMEPRAGGALRFDLGDHGEGVGTVLEWDEPSVLEYEWGEPGSEWRVRFELTDDGEGGTVLTFNHLLPDPSDPSFAAGWHWHLDRLSLHLAGGVPADVVSDEHFDDLLADYQATPVSQHMS
jgi:uncharacterized protein YndB with AHSA1/START domain